MRTINISLNVFNFEELSEAAKNNARRWYREHHEEDFSDEQKCLTAIGDIIGTSVYEYDAWGHAIVYITADYDEDMQSLVGVRAMKWVWNNWIEPNMKGKYFSTPGKYIDGKYHYKKTYSKATKVWDCPLTGFCMDMVLWEAYKTMQKGIKRGDQWTIEDYVVEVRDRFTMEWNNEIDARNSDEYIDEMLKENGYEFTENGNLFHEGRLSA